MKEYLKRLPKEIQDLISLAGDIAAKNNMSAYLVGGFVRDLILGVKNLDLDIVVEGNGIKFAEDFASNFEAKLISHRRFGTATVVLKSHQKVDIATARREFYPQPAHLPVVESGSLKDDLFRRDFTINAMAISIVKYDFGKLIDLFGGREDLRNKRIRILHDLSFIDDPTRILRAIRFEQRYNFKIEPKTLNLLKKAARQKVLEKVQPQRIRDDLILILKEKEPIKEIERLQQLAGLSFLSPHLKVSLKTRKLLSSVTKEIQWFRKACPQRRRLDTWLMYFIALLDRIGIKGVKGILRKLALRRGEEKRALSYKKISRKLVGALSKAEVQASQIFDLLEPLSYEVALLVKAKYKNYFLQRHIQDFLKVYNGTRISVCGRDLRDLGLSPGPYYQKIFAKVLKAKLDGLLKSRGEEVELIRKLIKNR